MLKITPLTVGLLAMVTAIATGVGVLPFAFRKEWSGAQVGLANALAAGLMTAASGLLIWEGAMSTSTERPLMLTLIGLALGVGFVWATRKTLDRYDDLHVGDLSGADAAQAILIMGVMTLHSMTEGIGVGVSFGGGEALGLYVTFAIALHNVPEGLAIALVLVPRGTSVGKAALWAIASSLPQPIFAVPAFLAVETFALTLPVGLGFAAGAMLWVALRELLPEALEEAPRRRVWAVAVGSVAIGAVVQWWL